MKKSIQYQGVEKRKEEKRAFEFKKVIKLQDDEIDRLKREYQMIKNQIQSAQNQYERINTLYESKIAILRNKISKESAKSRTNKIQEMRNHSGNINYEQASHATAIQKMQAMYEERRNFISLQNTNFNSPSSHRHIVESIDELKRLTEEVVNAKNLEQQKYIDRKLEEYKDEVNQYRSREIQLRELIEEASKAYSDAQELTRTRLEEAQKRHQIKLDTIEESISERENSILMQRAKSIAAINSIREEENTEIEKITENLNKKKLEVLTLKKKISKSKTELPQDLKSATCEASQLKMELGCYQNGGNDDSYGRLIQQEKLQLKKLELLKEQIDKNQQQREYILYENEKLKEEIRRLDFMIYGRNGEHQIKQCKQKRPFVPVGAPGI